MDFKNYLPHVAKQDPEIHGHILDELERQQTTLELIPSECATSLAVMEALGSVLTNKYSEGYPHKRYYGGNQFVDEIENLAQERAKEIFKVPHANVQPYSGSPANFAVYTAICEPGDTIMGQSLSDGGHLTHGCPVSASAKYFNSVQYHVTEEGVIDFEEVKKLAHENKPKLIWIGASAYSKQFPFKEISEIAEEVGAYVVADVAHVAGLIAGGAHPSPTDYVHVITTTTHKTLRGPRGAMIMVTQKGLDKDPDLAAKIDKAIFPGLQGGPHNHQTAAIAIALGEVLKPEFKDYAQQIVKNAKALAEALANKGFEIVGGGTENHLILIKTGKGRGVFFQDALDVAGMTVNKNTIPQEPKSPFYPSGVRIGTPIMTTRGLKESEMEQIADWFKRVFDEIEKYDLPKSKKEYKKYLKQFEEEIHKNDNLLKIKEEVAELCEKFPLYQS